MMQWIFIIFPYQFIKLKVYCVSHFSRELPKMAIKLICQKLKSSVLLFFNLNLYLYFKQTVSYQNMFYTFLTSSHILQRKFSYKKTILQYLKILSISVLLVSSAIQQILFLECLFVSTASEHSQPIMTVPIFIFNLWISLNDWP